jgi:hypothetical protein
LSLDDDEVVIVPPTLPPFELHRNMHNRSDYKLMAKTGTSSQWWKHFKIYHPMYLREDPDSKDKAVCLTCGDEINVAKGISGLSGHMQHHHTDMYMQIKHPKLYNGSNGGSRVGIDKLLGATKLPSKETRKAEILNAITAWVIEENQPLNAVEKPAFKRMLQTIDRTCPLPTRSNLREDIMYLGKVAREALKQELSGKYFSVTTDHWTSPNDETYSCLTVHWIENGVMHRAVLAFEVFHGTTTGVALGEDFQRVFDLFNFDLKYVVAVVTDTTGNMNTFGECLRQKGVAHLYCVDHVLNLNSKLAYNDTNLPDADNAMKAARNLVETFTKSTQAMEKLLQQQRVNSNYQGSKPLKAIQDVVTRWWSTYRMLARLRYLRKAIQTLIINTDIAATDLTPNQYKVLDEVEGLLKPTATAQELLEGDEYPTISLVPYYLDQIRCQYEAMVNPSDGSIPTPSTSHLARVLLADFEKRYLARTAPVFSTDIRRVSGRYVGMQSQTIIASALDPRTKSLRPFIPANEHKVIWEEVYKLMVTVKEADSDLGDSAVTTTPDNDECRPAKKAKIGDAVKDMFHALIASNNQPRTNTSDANKVCHDELMRYKLEVCLPIFCEKSGSFTDPLQWWESHKHQYPTLFELSLRYLSIPATSAPSERLWSMASRILTIRRASLESTIVGDMMFVKENSSIMNKHFYKLTGEERILPKVYPEAEEDGEMGRTSEV